jgi:CheY-like chemotaxis protein
VDVANAKSLGFQLVAFDLKQQLEALGYRVAALVPSGEQAVEKAAELQPDVVLMDIHLEGAMDGIAAAQQIHERWRLPVVFLTAYAEDETLQRAQASLPFGYLVKPVDIRELHATLQMALIRRAAEVAVERSEERLQLALDAAELGVWEWEAATGRVTAAGHLDALLGGVPEPLGETWESFIARVHPEDREAVERTLRETLPLDSSLNFSLPLPTPR